MAHTHSPGFLKLVQSAKAHVRSFSIDEFLANLQAGERYILIDVREASESAKGQLPSAYHISKGTIEREIERAIPEQDTPVVLYCDDGFRSVLTAESLQKMGYSNITSLDGGWRGWIERGLPTISPEAAE